MFGFIFKLFLIVIIVSLVVSSIRIVPQGMCYVVEFLGKYKETWQAGIHMMIPVLSRVARRVSLKEQVADFPPQSVITKDNVTMEIDTVVYYKVFDAALFTYGVEQPVMALENLTATTLRNIIGDLELDQTLTSRDKVNSEMKIIIDEATDAWGIRVNRVELKNIIPPREIRDAMEKQMKAEREKRQTILEAQAHKESSITRAQGDKEALIIRAQADKEARIAKASGEAEAIRLVYEAQAKGIELLKEAKMDESVLALKKLEALKELGDGRATKIIVPTDLTKAATDLTYVSEFLGTPSSEPIDKSEKSKPVEIVEDVCCESDQMSAVTKEFVEKPPKFPNF
ncbi:SPFH domain-containing protein [Floccifex sp.]|uniref:SPFH domain-containing protein n=1 Tax=Floccifex sp. TaxID=2815810 RepID=UPI003F0D2DA6